MWKTSQSAAPNVWNGEKGAKSTREWRPSEWPPTRSSPCVLQAPGRGPPASTALPSLTARESGDHLHRVLLTTCAAHSPMPQCAHPGGPAATTSLPGSPPCSPQSGSELQRSFSLHAVPGLRLSFGSRDHPISGFLCRPSEITYHPRG